MYGKLVNGELIEAPVNYTSEDGNVITGFNKSIFHMVKYGFKPVNQNVPPYDAYSQRIVFSRYEETEDMILAHYDVIDKLKPDSYEELQTKVTTLEEELLNAQNAIDYLILMSGSEVDNTTSNTDETVNDTNEPISNTNEPIINTNEPIINTNKPVNNTDATVSTLGLGSVKVLDNNEDNGKEVNSMAIYLASRIIKGKLPYRVVCIFPELKEEVDSILILEGKEDLIK